MKISLTVQETLIWHDYPHLFVAKDKIGGLQLCIAIDDTPQYISVALSVNRLQDLKLSKIKPRLTRASMAFEKTAV